MIQTAVTDVIGPAVAAKDPMTAFDKELFFFIQSCAFIALALIFSKTAVNASARSRVPSLTSILSSQSCIAAFRSAGISVAKAAFTISATRSRDCFTPRYIPKPYSALSSKREFAQLGPWPLLLVVYGMEGALAPRWRNSQ